MLRMISVALVALAITTTSALGADNSVGTWKVNVAKVKYTPAPWPVKSVTSVREAVPDGIKVTNTGERTDGSAINSTYTAKYDGSPASVSGSGAPYDTVSIKQVDGNTFTYDAKKSDGKYKAHGRIVISADGKIMTMSAKGTDADGKPMTITLVYEKQ